MWLIGVILIVLQLAGMISAIRKKCKRNWFLALAAETVSLAAGVGLTVYYNDLPGQGKAPGLTYFGEIFWGAGLTGICILFLVVSMILFTVQFKKMVDKD